MRRQRHFDTNPAAQRETAQIWKMIDELDRGVQLLNADIAAEQLAAIILRKPSPRSNGGFQSSIRLS
jgi:hypothetical protein